MLNLSDDWWFLGQAVHWIAWRNCAFAHDDDLSKWEPAEQRLFSFLGDGKLIARGVNEAEAFEEIPSRIWAKAASGDALAPAIVSYASEGGGDLGGRVEHQGRTWADVHLPRADIESLWPALEPDLAEACRNALCAGHTSQSAALAAVKSAGVNCTRGKFLDVWKTVAGPQKQGPKGPRKKHAGMTA